MTITNTTQRGYGYAWQKLRKRALWRDKGLCQSCLKQGRTREAKDVDHIKRKADGGEDHIDNLQSLCSECHEAKTARENGARKIAFGADGYPIGG